jgi:hypothetical protein
MQSESLPHKTGLQSAEVKLLALPRQQAGQFWIANVSRSTFSSKQGADSAEHCLASPSHVTVSLTGGEVGLVLASLAWQVRPAPSSKAWSSLVVALPELQARKLNAKSGASRSIEGHATDARRFMTG